MRTRAAILDELNKPLTIDEVEIGDPKQGEVLVRMVASGVCHTDVSVMHGILPSPTPVILGHEGAGIVEAVGPGVTKLAKGDHVVTAAVPHCTHCRACLSGEPFFCATGLPLALGGTMTDGTKRFRRGKEEIGHFFLQSSFAELTLVPQQIAVKVPKELPLEKMGPLACGIETGSGAVLNIAKVRPGDTVAVFGCGGVGLSAVMAARICRAKTIIAVDMLDARLAMAKQLGANETINAKGTDAVQAIQALTGGGVDYAFECIGRAATIRQAVDATRVGGTAVVSGAVAAGSEVTLDGLGMILKNVKANIEGGSIPDVFIPRLVDFWQNGEFPFDRLIGKTYAHADVNQAIAGMESGEVIKPVILY
jgi:aryl-alcohol dehydrogenase